MKGTDKIVTRCGEGELPESFSDALRNADEEDMRVLLAAILLEQKNGAATVADVCETLGLGAGELSASLKYWRGAGLIGRSRKSSNASKKASDGAEPEKIPSAHRRGAVQSSEMPHYATLEIAQLIEKRKGAADFISEAQRVYGKMFNQAEIAIILRMTEYIGFDEECVLTLLSFYSKPERKSIRYIEKVALEFYDEDINNIEALGAKLCSIERARSVEGQIRSMFGMGSRALTSKEKKYITSWTEKMSFDMDMIRLAYDITVEKTHEATPAYANAILERWYADGINTVEAARESAEKRAEKKNVEDGKSFDKDDFFEAALRRAYEN